MKRILFVLLTILLSSCLEEVVVPQKMIYSNASDLIAYIETRTNFFNLDDQPLVTIDELNQNLGNYLVVDIREEFDYRIGHVPGAINIQIKDLLTYLKGINTLTYPKVVIVSSTGQLASYALSLMIIAGYENIFSLDGGMTYWNKIFSDELINAKANAVRYIGWHLTSIPSENNAPPDVLYKNNPKTIEERIGERIQLLLNEPAFNIFLSAEEFDSRYDMKQKGYVNTFVVYSYPIKLLPRLAYGEARKIKGPISATLYDTPYAFNSHQSIFTLPTNRNIVLYSDYGQRSMFITAYLKLLGYSVRSIKYGKISMMFLNITAIYDKTGGVVGYMFVPLFDMEKRIRDYPYEVGE